MSEEIVAIIQKISFGNRSQVYPENYLDERQYLGRWNTPRPYKAVSGRRFKLMLYNPLLKALTVEVEIESVDESREEAGFPWSNRFAAGTWRVYETPIGLDRIRNVAGLEKFGDGQAAYRNINERQYEALVMTTSVTYDLDSAEAFEGYLSDQRYLRMTRNRAIVEERKLRDAHTCQGCGFRLQINGRFIIDCHHLVPLQETEERVTSVDELVCLCPTCHRISHTRRPPYTPREIRCIRDIANLAASSSFT